MSLPGQELLSSWEWWVEAEIACSGRFLRAFSYWRSKETLGDSQQAPLPALQRDPGVPAATFLLAKLGCHGQYPPHMLKCLKPSVPGPGRLCPPGFGLLWKRKPLGDVKAASPESSRVPTNYKTMVTPGNQDISNNNLSHWFPGSPSKIPAESWGPPDQLVFLALCCSPFTMLRAEYKAPKGNMFHELTTPSTSSSWNLWAAQARRKNRLCNQTWVWIPTPPLLAVRVWESCFPSLSPAHRIIIRFELGYQVCEGT